MYSCMMGGGSLELVISNGVAFAHAGDTVVIVYAAPARLHRTQWLFDRLEERVARAAPLNALMVLLPASEVPDADTRAENTRRMANVRGQLRSVVTVVVGDSMRISLVRTIMRAIFLVQGLSKVQQIVCSVSEGLALLLSDPTPRMPSRSQLDASLREIARQLDCSL
ncbi:MAG TPA: hypothetical protein VFN67_10840, partial [Polyangiales bacterium]|nr:hypothetical protein [Polyangiales bacterium]